MLHMVPYLVGDDIRVGEIPSGSDCRFHLFEEIEVDIDCLVCRAIERADLRGGVAASRLHRAGEHHQFRAAVFTPALATELRSPYILRSGENLGGEVGQSLILRVGLIGLFGLLARSLADDSADDIAYVPSAEQGYDAGHDYADDTAAYTHGASREPSPV